MRVVVVCPYSLSRPGGVQGQVTGLARALRAGDHQVAVMAPDDSHGPGMVDPTTFSVGRSSAVRSNGSVAPVSLSPGSAVRAHRFVREFAPDVVHLHEPLAPLAGYGCLVASPVPVIGTYHRAGDSRAYRALGPIARWADGRLAARCAVSAAAAATIGSVVGRDCRVLFNGVEIDRFGGAEPWPTEGPTVLFLGRHEQRKGLGILLEAFARVPDPVVLWVAGDGPATGELRRQYPESARLRWLGMLDDDQVARRLAGADVLCAPSLGGESFGMVLLEAMAAGCAVVASDLPGYRAAAGGHARLVSPGDPGALAQGLTEVLAGLAEAGGSEGGTGGPGALAHAERWSMDRLAERYVEIYREVTARAPSPPAVT